VRYIWLRRAYLGLRSDTRALRPAGSASVRCWRKCEVGTASSNAEFEGEAENIFAYSVLLSLDTIRTSGAGEWHMFTPLCLFPKLQSTG
jgi:hypothetical protein